MSLGTSIHRACASFEWEVTLYCRFSLGFFSHLDLVKCPATELHFHPGQGAPPRSLRSPNGPKFHSMGPLWRLRWNRPFISLIVAIDEKRQLLSWRRMVTLHPRRWCALYYAYMYLEKLTGMTARRIGTEIVFTIDYAIFRLHTVIFQLTVNVYKGNIIIEVCPWHNAPVIGRRSADCRASF